VTRAVIVDVLLVLGVAVMWMSALGVLAMRTVFDRLHYLGPASTLGPALFGLAMVVQEGGKSEGFKGLFGMLLFAVLSPLVTHAVALAARTRTFGAFTITPEEEPKR
jgi:multicomponent Na+:H+ antiporter subunit G